MPTAPSLSSSPDLDTYALRRIEYRVRRLKLALNLSAADADDVRQDLMLDLWSALARYDPARASRATFISRVLDRAYCSVARKLRARRRRESQAVVSFSESAERLRSPDPVSQADGQSSARLDLALDLEAALARLPRNLRILAEQLKSRTAAEIARERGQHRCTVYREIVALRAIFRECGLDPASCGSPCDRSGGGAEVDKRTEGPRGRSTRRSA